MRVHGVSDEGVIMSAKNKPNRNPESAKMHIEKMLDEALKQTFPASDAVAIDVPRRNPGGRAMTSAFKVGDHVTWNSEAGRVSGRIVKVHKRNVNYKGYVHHASRDAPQYAIKSDKTDHIALHKGTALKLIRR